MKNEDYYNSDEYRYLVENSPYEICPNCNEVLDDFEMTFQTCSVCGWEGENL